MRFRLVDESAFSREGLAALDGPVAGLFSIDRSLRGLAEKVILPRFGWAEEEASAALTLKELETMLAESIDRWNREVREEGRQEGRQEGEARVVLRLLRLKFGPLAPETEERVLAADTDRLLEWSERVLTAERLQDVFRD